MSSIAENAEKKVRFPNLQNMPKINESCWYKVTDEHHPNKTEPSRKMILVVQFPKMQNETSAILEWLQAFNTASSIVFQSNPTEADYDNAMRTKLSLLNAEGGYVPENKVVDILQVSVDQVQNLRRQGELIGIKTETKGYVYPRWQFDGNQILPGLPGIFQLLHEHDPWMKLAFMVARNAALQGSRPIQLLRAGQIEAVQRAARVYGEQGSV